MDHLNEVFPYLTNAAKAVQACCRDQLKQFDVEPTQQKVLYCLWHQDGMHPISLAQEINISPATITGVLIRMEKKGLLQRRCKPNNPKNVIVYLTEKGKALERMITSCLEELDARLTEDVPDQELEKCIALLKKLITNANNLRILE